MASFGFLAICIGMLRDGDVFLACVYLAEEFYDYVKTIGRDKNT